MSEQDIKNLTLLGFYVICFLSMLCTADIISRLIISCMDKELKYGNAKVGDCLAPR